MKQKALRLTALLLIAISSTVNPLSAHSHKGEKILGVRAGYITRNTTSTAGIYFQYRCNKYLAVSPNIDYVFRSKGSDAFLFNFDLHVPFALDAARNVEIYPLLGLNYTSWGYHFHDLDVSSRLNHFGFNVGAGLDWHITSEMVLTLRGKYQGVKDLDAGSFTVGLGYSF